MSDEPNWYEGYHPNVARVFSSNKYEVDYDLDRRLYRVSVFEDGHYQDEVCFRAYGTAPLGLDVASLLESVKAHIDSLTDEELMASARRAAAETTGFDDEEDIVEIVRCKDCAHAIEYEDAIEGEQGLRCPLWGAAGINPLGFCHNGKPKNTKVSI